MPQAAFVRLRLLGVKRALNAAKMLFALWHQKLLIHSKGDFPSKLI